VQEKQKSGDRDNDSIILRIFLGWRFLLQGNKMIGTLPLRSVSDSSSSSSKSEILAGELDPS